MVIGAIAIIGSTFAANINLNSGQPVEFGQGMTKTTACGDITLTPQATFDNSSGGNPTNSLIYPITGDYLGYGYNNENPPSPGLGYSTLGGIKGVANYVQIRVAASVGNQTSGVADPGGITGTRAAVIHITGNSAAVFYSPSVGTLSADGKLLMVPANNVQFDLRVLTPFEGNAMVNIYKEVSSGVFSSTSAESVEIISSVFDAVDYSFARFKLDSIVLSDIPSTCYGKNFILSAFDNSSNNPLYIYAGWPGSTAQVTFDSTTSLVKSGSSGYTVTQLSSSGIKVSFSKPRAGTAKVAKITLESTE
jgi:hypothetical protein